MRFGELGSSFLNATYEICPYCGRYLQLILFLLTTFVIGSNGIAFHSMTLSQFIYIFLLIGTWVI